MPITLSFKGAAEGVTGSRHLLQVDDTKILVDCGLFQGRRHWAYEQNQRIPCPPDELHNIILTHGHIDHCGTLPLMVKLGLEGRIFCTDATADLAKLLLRDSAHIQEQDARYFNRRLEKRRRRGEKLTSGPVEPLYEMKDAEKCDAHFHGFPYEHEETIGPGMTVSFTDQGHIIGSGAALVDIKRKGKRKKTRIVFGGDIGRPEMPILRDPQPYPECDYIVTESTYGNRNHKDIGDSEEALRAVAKKTFDRGGKLLIPAFAVGRTQRLLYFLHRLFRDERLTRVPVFVDSPLATKATRIYAEHPECFDKETLKFLKKGVNPFEFDQLTYVDSVQESKELNEREGPHIVIASSGMCEGGRIMHHLKHTVPSKRNTVLLVGYMAAHTLGRKLMEGTAKIRLWGDKYPVRCRVAKINGLSAHADGPGLVQSLDHLKGRLKGIFLVHGEPDSLDALQRRLEDAGHKNVQIGRLNSTVTLED